MVSNRYTTTVANTQHYLFNNEYLIVYLSNMWLHLEYVALTSITWISWSVCQPPSFAHHLICS